MKNFKAKNAVCGHYNVGSGTLVYFILRPYIMSNLVLFT
ncbi:hypothetical protein SLEP1_g55453 [Rubroshorea leprosula]|uniref:Uncharacterized protein n=1 Tax=Rubroshorea leprosula TaxID=152421 RepID=A0AAV5MJ93_9ROSI|nr:hypothetical protein SLEP1_g55453 [Rubroshorea leprosula]